MPQELVIILAIVIGAIWLLWKIGQGILATIDEATRNYNVASARRKAHRHAKKRDDLRPHVLTTVPNELDNFEGKLETARVEFEDAQELTNWVASPPTWTKGEYRPFPLPHKRNDYCEMCIDDIDAVLTPNPAHLTWSTQESVIIGRQCKYPSEPPVGRRGKFVLFSTITAVLKTAESVEKVRKRKA